MLHVNHEWAQQPHLRLTIYAPLSAMCSLAVSKPAQLGLHFTRADPHSTHIRMKLRMPCEVSGDTAQAHMNAVSHNLEIENESTSLYAQGPGLERHHLVENLPTSYYRRRLKMLAGAVQLPRHIFRQIAAVQLMSIGRYAYNASSRPTMKALEQALTFGEAKESRE